MPTIRVRPGDSLARLAAEHGVPADTIWNHPRNGALKQRRPNPNILQPGDELFVPDRSTTDLAVHSGAVNQFVATVPTTQLTVTLRDASLFPFANRRCSASGAPTADLTTDGDGRLVLTVPVATREVIVRIEDGPTFAIGVGHVDPLDEPGGMAARLRYLGLLDPDSAFDESVSLRVALSLFQAAHRLPPSGEVDAETRLALLAVHGG